MENNSADQRKSPNLPQFRDIQMVSDGWIKKYLLTY